MDFQIVAENAFHRGRRLLVGSDGVGYIQLDLDQVPIPVPGCDFARLRDMNHYRPGQQRAGHRLLLAPFHEEYLGLSD